MIRRCPPPLLQVGVAFEKKMGGELNERIEGKVAGLSTPQKNDEKGGTVLGSARLGLRCPGKVILS